MELTIKETRQYLGQIVLNKEVIANLSQTFDQQGHMTGGISSYIVNKDLYYEHLQECREQEDSFREKMRKVEDEFLGIKVVEDNVVEGKDKAKEEIEEVVENENQE